MILPHNSTILQKSPRELYDRVANLETFIQNSPLIQLAFACNGFIAGGFLNTCLRNGTFNPDTFKDDIDIFFCNLAGWKAFQKAMDDFGLEYETGLHALNVYHHGIKHQIIYYRYFPPIDTLDGFDIDNAKIALSNGTFYISETREQYEQDNAIHLCMGGFSMYDKVMYRLPKYFRKGYTKISLGSKVLVRNWMMNSFPMKVPAERDARNKFIEKILIYNIPDIREQRLYEHLNIYEGNPSILNIVIDCFDEIESQT